MDLIDYLISNISQLPQNMIIVGSVLIGWFLLRAVFSVLRLRLISAATNVLYALIIALVLSRYGTELSAYLDAFLNADGASSEKISESSSTSEQN